MAPTKTDTGHGGLFDLFPERPQAVHGSNLYDEGFQLQNKPAVPHGRNFDEWGTPTADSAHGERWDEFGWKDMPEFHGGTLYDEGFASPSANESTRGPLYDLFQPSTRVKYIFDGKDAEGIVQGVTQAGDVVVQPRGGNGAVEVGVSQFLQYSSPSVDNAATKAPPSTAEAPSARKSTARGAGRQAAPDTGSPVSRVAPGPGNPDARNTGVPTGLMSTVDHLKSMFGGNDIEKTDGVMGCPRCGGGTTKVTGGVHSCVSCDHAWSVTGNHVTPLKTGKPLATKSVRLPSELLKSHSEWVGMTSVAKEVTAAQAAIQGEDGAAILAGRRGAGSYCPECRESKGKLTDDGRCPDCQTALKAHDGSKPVSREKGDGNGDAESSAGKGVAEKASGMLDDLRKAFGATGDPGTGGQTVTLTGRDEPDSASDRGKAKSDPSGPTVPEREHKDSDHHSSGSGIPTTCPHCGQAIAELNAKAEQGAPTHKCLGGTLDTLKTLVAA